MHLRAMQSSHSKATSDDTRQNPRCVKNLMVAPQLLAFQPSASYTTSLCFTASVEHGWTLYQGQTRSNQPKVADREPSTLISIWSMTFHSYRDGHCHNGFQQVLPIWSITAFQYISGKIKLKTARKCLTLNRKVQHLIWKPKDSDSWFRTLETQFGFGN